MQLRGMASSRMTPTLRSVMDTLNMQAFSHSSATDPTPREQLQECDVTCSAFWDTLERHGVLSLNVRVNGTTKTQPQWTESDEAWADALVQMLAAWQSANSAVTPLVVTIGSSPVMPKLTKALAQYPRRSHAAQPM
ncbi:unnamed protein product [Polarella glacialis]|uniref:Uncharacterized protein n=1 Tax=Polarella glacialis TaxID=89957 RepID=A0A813L033_POLGL|nr:unnamed protein product [Polarella glacialis]